MVVVPWEPASRDEAQYSGGAESHLPIYLLGKDPCSCQIPSPHFTPAPQMPQPSARCALRQLAAPWVSAGQKMSAAHTPHTGCSQSLQQLVILKEYVLAGKLIRKQGYLLPLLYVVFTQTHTPMGLRLRLGTCTSKLMAFLVEREWLDNVASLTAASPSLILEVTA